jgi:hypothetical protein
LLVSLLEFYRKACEPLKFYPARPGRTQLRPEVLKFYQGAPASLWAPHSPFPWRPPAGRGRARGREREKGGRRGRERGKERGKGKGKEQGKGKGKGEGAGKGEGGVKGKGKWIHVLKPQNLLKTVETNKTLNFQGFMCVSHRY